MKVGILTLHSQLNYGGVLQAYALQETIKSLGHEVIVIDRSVYRDNTIFRGILNNTSIIDWINFIGRGLLGFGDFADLRRRIKTKQFINNALYLSPFSFFHWKDAPKSLGVDLLVIGSDQVWNPADPNILSVHLLEGAPKIKAISYAASFGIRQIPPELRDRYAAGIARLDKVSVRESEGAKIASELGFSATRVLDPVLLSNPMIWDNICKPQPSKRKVLFCYFLGLKIDDLVPDLIAFAKQHKATIKAFSMEGCIELPPSLSAAAQIPIRAIKQKLSRLDMRSNASPDEFVSDIKSSSWVLTDSFHALAFSIVFKKNVRIIRPTDAFRKNMFARIEESVEKYVSGPAISNSCHDALASFSAGEQISFDETILANDRAHSLQWIKGAIEESHA